MIAVGARDGVALRGARALTGVVSFIEQAGGRKI